MFQTIGGPDPVYENTNSVFIHGQEAIEKADINLQETVEKTSGFIAFFKSIFFRNPPGISEVKIKWTDENNTEHNDTYRVKTDSLKKYIKNHEGHEITTPWWTSKQIIVKKNIIF